MSKETVVNAYVATTQKLTQSGTSNQDISEGFMLFLRLVCKMSASPSAARQDIINQLEEFKES